MSGYSTGYYDVHLARLIYNRSRIVERQMQILEKMGADDPARLSQRLKVNAEIVTLRRMVDDIQIY